MHGLINKYAPPYDSNDSTRYANTISQLMGTYRNKLAWRRWSRLSGAGRR
jgi:hypothetical protein